MPQIDSHLQRAQLHLKHATRELELARAITITKGYGTHYKLAIDRALVQNQETWIHVGNVTSQFKSHPTPPPPKKGS